MNEIAIYTDGTSKDNIGAWCAIILCDGVQVGKFSGFEFMKTNNRMELKATVKALKNLLYGNVKIKVDTNKKLKIVVYSDSAYVVNTCNKGQYIKWKMNGWKTNLGEPVKNNDLWIEMFEILSVLKLSGIEVLFEKVKAHSGNFYNELADKMAKKEIIKAKQIRKKRKNKILKNGECHTS